VDSPILLVVLLFVVLVAAGKVVLVARRRRAARRAADPKLAARAAIHGMTRERRQRLKGSIRGGGQSGGMGDLGASSEL